MNVMTERYEFLVSQWLYLNLRTAYSEESLYACLMVEMTNENVIDDRCTRFELQYNFDYNYPNIFYVVTCERFPVSIRDTAIYCMRKPENIYNCMFYEINVEFILAQ